jgi:chromosome segregation ATPase
MSEQTSNGSELDARLANLLSQVSALQASNTQSFAHHGAMILSMKSLATSQQLIHDCAVLADAEAGEQIFDVEALSHKCGALTAELAAARAQLVDRAQVNSALAQQLQELEIKHRQSCEDAAALKEKLNKRAKQAGDLQKQLDLSLNALEKAGKKSRPAAESKSKRLEELEAENARLFRDLATMQEQMQGLGEARQREVKQLKEGFKQQLAALRARAAPPGPRLGGGRDPSAALFVQVSRYC